MKKAAIPPGIALAPPVDQVQFRVVPARHPVRWLLAALIISIFAILSKSISENDRFRFHAVSDYFFSPAILTGLETTLALTVAAMAAGIAIGLFIAIIRLSHNPLLRILGWLYVWVFRGTPLLVQLVIWYNLGILFDTVTVAIPGGWVLFSAPMNSVITGFTAALLGLGLNEGAYMSEIIRAGILAIDRGQTEAAQAVGLTRFETLRYIVVPQAIRIVIPPTVNQLISMLKTTSLVSVIAGGDLLTNVQNIYSSNFLVLELLIVASIWYLIITTIISVFQFYIERRFYGAQRVRTPNNTTSDRPTDAELGQ